MQLRSQESAVGQGDEGAIETRAGKPVGTLGRPTDPIRSHNGLYRELEVVQNER